MNQAFNTREKAPGMTALQGGNYLTPNLQNGETRESLTNQGLIPLDQVTETSQMLDTIAFEIGIPANFFHQIKERLFLNQFLHLLQPNALGGFHTKDKYIQFSQQVFTSPDTKFVVAHVLFHEYLHMIGIGDEAVVEMMTIRRMRTVYGRIGITSGYVHIVDELESLIGDKTFDELFILMDREENERLNAIVSEVVLQSAFKDFDSIEDIKLSNLMESAKSKWNWIMRLFPRLGNEVDNREVHPFEPAILQWYELNKLQIAEAIAEQIILDPLRAQKFLGILFDEDNEEQRREIMGNPEYQYLFAYAEKYGINLYTYYDSISRQLYGNYEM